MLVSAPCANPKTDLPGVDYELDDGTVCCVAGPLASTVPGLIQKLSFTHRRKFEEQMSNAYAKPGPKC